MRRSDPAITTHRAAWVALLCGSLLSLLVAVLVSAQSIVLGSRRGGWVYEYLFAFQPHTLIICAIACGCCAAVATVPLTEARRSQWRIVGLWLIVGLLVQGVLRSLTPYSVEQMLVSDGSNGFYSAAQQYRPTHVLADFDRIRPTFASIHARSNMPGKVLFMAALQRLSDRPVLLAWVVIGISDLGGLLLYLFVRDFLGDPESALLSMVFYLIVPAKLVFLPVLNTITPVVVLACVWLWWRTLVGQSGGYAAAAGVAAYGLILFEPTPAVLAVLLAVLTGDALRRHELEWPAAVRLTAVAALSFLTTYAALRAWWHFDLLTSVRAVARDAIEFNASANRPYGTWITSNLTDFFFGTGVCQAVLFLYGLTLSCSRDVWRGLATQRRFAGICIGTAAVLLVADLAGVNRGEVVRLWIFIACLVQIPAAYLCASLESRLAVAIVVGTTLLQAGLSTSMLAFGQP